MLRVTGDKTHQHADPPHLLGLRVRRKRPRRRPAAEQRDELAPFHCPVPPVLRTKDSTALLRCGISIPARTAWGHERPEGDVGVESVRLPTADIGRRGWHGRKVPNVWPGRAVQDGLPRSTNVRAASMYQASEVEQFAPGHHGYPRASEAD